MAAVYVLRVQVAAVCPAPAPFERLMTGSLHLQGQIYGACAFGSLRGDMGMRFLYRGYIYIYICRCRYVEVEVDTDSYVGSLKGYSK